MSLSREFPILYGQDKTGKTKVWRASVFLNPTGTAYSLIEYGQLSGKMQSSRRDVTVGKNVGKKNETSPLQQCLQETERKWIDKRDKENYSENVNSESSEEERTYSPMLAQTLKKDKLQFPCYVQPKIDGLRCLFYRRNGEWVAQSRTGATFTTVDHIKAVLPLLREGEVFDGELYTTRIPFETLAGLIKKKKLTSEDLEKLRQVEYHCYDMYMEDTTFEERHERLSSLSLEYPIVRVETTLIDSVEEFDKKFSEYTTSGFEGIMIRSITGKYALNYRSKDLCKYKEFEEGEYKIIGYTQGDGRDAGTVIWICETPEGKVFHVRPRGTVEHRSEWYQSGKENVGKMLTVVYQNLSEQGVPRFPVGKAIRDGY